MLAANIIFPGVDSQDNQLRLIAMECVGQVSLIDEEAHKASLDNFYCVLKENDPDLQQSSFHSI
jgi:hypothetical protein